MRDELAEWMKCEVDGAASDFEMIERMVHLQLKCKDEDTLKYMKTKMQRMQVATGFGHELLQVDEARECLIEEDQKDLRKQQEKAPELEASLRKFST